MTLLGIRWKILLLMIITLCLMLVLNGSALFPAKIGIVSASAVDGEGNIGTVYLDVDTGLLAQTLVDTDLLSHILSTPFVLTYTVIDNQQSYYLVRNRDRSVRFISNDGTGEQLISTYDDLEPIELIWANDSQTLWLIESYFDRGTRMYTVNTVDGTLTQTLDLPDFEAEAVDVSTNQTHLLIREPQAPTTSIMVEPKPMQLVDLRSGTVVDLGLPHFAYWSPNNEKLAVGYASSFELETDIFVYEIANDTWFDLGIRGSRIDLPFYYQAQATGVLWSPDSQGLAILNQLTTELHYLTLSGELSTIPDSNLRPIQWSPDGQALATVGYYQDSEIGGVIVDFVDARVHVLNTGELFGFVNSRFRWSPDSNYLLYVRSGSPSWVLVYDAQGRLIRDQIPLAVSQGLRTRGTAVDWVESI